MVLETLRKGRARLAAIRTDADARALASEIGLGPARSTLLPWLVAHDPGRITAFLSPIEIFWVGLESRPVDGALQAWGSPAGPRLGCLCVQLLDRRPWETFAGRWNLRRSRQQLPRSQSPAGGAPLRPADARPRAPRRTRRRNGRLHRQRDEPGSRRSPRSGRIRAGAWTRSRRRISRLADNGWPSLPGGGLGAPRQVQDPPGLEGHDDRCLSARRSPFVAALSLVSTAAQAPTLDDRLTRGRRHPRRQHTAARRSFRRTISRRRYRPSPSSSTDACVCTVEQRPSGCTWDPGTVVRGHHIRVVATLADGGGRLVGEPAHKGPRIRRARPHRSRPRAGDRHRRRPVRPRAEAAGLRSVRGRHPSADRELRQRGRRRSTWCLRSTSAAAWNTRWTM